MSHSGSLRHFIRSPRNAVLLFVLAAVVWSFIYWQSLRSAPAQRHIEAGAQLLARQQGAAAEREWREAIRLNPTDAAPWELLGDYYVAISNWPEALDAFGHVQKLRPDTPNLHSRLALAALRVGNYKMAQQHSGSALEQNATDLTALKVAASVAEKNENPDQQLKYLRQLVALQPEDSTLLLALADALASQQQNSEALSLLDRVLQLNPRLVTAYALRGKIYSQDNPTPARLAKAEADFKKVLEAEPDNIQARGYLGRIYMSLNRPSEAIRHLEEIGRDRPYASGHLFELAKAYRKAGNTRKADALLNLYSSLKQLNHQLVELITRTNKSPNDFDSYVQIAQLLLTSVDSSEAAYHFYRYKYLQRHLGSVTAYVNKATQLRPRDARLRTLSQQANRVHERHLQQGLMSIKRRDYKRADWHLGRAVLLRPDDARTRQAVLRLAKQ